MSAATAYLAGATPRRPSRFRRIVDQLRSRCWGTARFDAGILFHLCGGRLYQDTRTGAYGTLEAAYANRGSIFSGARVHVRLRTHRGRSLYLPYREARLADEVERTLWSLRTEGRAV